MGAALSFIALPAIGGIGSILASCFSAAACSLACRSCNCNNSIATRVGYAVRSTYSYPILLLIIDHICCTLTKNHSSFVFSIGIIFSSLLCLSIHWYDQLP